jgi:hypothetical protein
MMGICSFFGLSHGLSLLVEVVRMLLMGKKGKPAERWLGCPSALWRLHADKRRQRCWGRGLSPAGQVSIGGSSRSVWVSRRAYRRAEGAPKVVLTTKYSNKSDAEA